MLGLTGAVGAGKSTAATVLAASGCIVLDVDRMGHEALDLPSVASAVAREFGPDVLRGDGRTDREALARRVFGDPGALRRLEALVHPAVLARLGADLDAARAAAPRAVVIDCALLFEGSLDRMCDTTLVVVADAAVRARRVAESRGWSAEDLRRREAAQLPAAEKKARAGRVVPNDGDLEELRRRLADLLDDVAPARGTGVPAGAGDATAGGSRADAGRGAGRDSHG